MSERITWTNCPDCGATAAVGWIGDRPVELDCFSGCSWWSEQPPVRVVLAPTALSGR
ncbi:hypothetical protein [Trujillonella endophytica]|nr:hypothetical protein [Trujillella endophytica]